MHPSSPEDGTYLCPNDLLGRASSAVPQGPFLSRVSDKHRFDHLQEIANEYWRKWSRDVFPNLFIRHKSHVERRNVSVGDIVLIQDANLFRGEWKRGRVTEAIPSRDGRIRRVKVTYKHFKEKERGNPDYKGTFDTEIERPVQRLIVLLPIEHTHTNWCFLWSGVFRTTSKFVIIYHVNLFQTKYIKRIKKGIKCWRAMLL